MLAGSAAQTSGQGRRRFRDASVPIPADRKNRLLRCRAAKRGEIAGRRRLPPSELGQPPVPRHIASPKALRRSSPGVSPPAIPRASSGASCAHEGAHGSSATTSRVEHAVPLHEHLRPLQAAQASVSVSSTLQTPPTPLRRAEIALRPPGAERERSPGRRPGLGKRLQRRVRPAARRVESVVRHQPANASNPRAPRAPATARGPRAWPGRP